MQRLLLRLVPSNQRSGNAVVKNENGWVSLTTLAERAVGLFTVLIGTYVWEVCSIGLYSMSSLTNLLPGILRNL